MIVLVLILGFINLVLLILAEVKSKKLNKGTIKLITECSDLNKRLLEKMSKINLIVYDPKIEETKKIEKIKKIIYTNRTDK